MDTTIGKEPPPGVVHLSSPTRSERICSPRYVEDNLTIEEREALRNLRQCTDIVIKPEDKGSSFVVMDKSEYIRSATAELSNSKFYFRESQDLNFQTELKVNAVVDLMYSDGEIDSKVANYLKPSGTKKVLGFTPFPKRTKSVTFRIFLKPDR